MLQPFDFPLGTGQFFGDIDQDIFVSFRFRQNPQFLRLVQRPADPVQRAQF